MRVSGSVVMRTSESQPEVRHRPRHQPLSPPAQRAPQATSDRKSTRLNSSHANISYAVFCLKKKKQIRQNLIISEHTSTINYKSLSVDKNLFTIKQFKS